MNHPTIKAQTMWLRSSKRRTSVSEPTPATIAKAEGPSMSTSECADVTALLASLDRSLAIIEFKPDGTIVKANENFLKTMGYRLNEVVGQHHRIFVTETYGLSEAYSQFWNELAQGKFQSGEFERQGRNNRSVWIQATYNPVFDSAGRVVKVVKFAADITEQKQMIAEIQNRSSAVIEFEPNGTIITANSLFLSTMGYNLEEICGRHHRMFLFSEDSAKPEYSQFWKRLSSGEIRTGEFRRMHKRGNEVWLHGAYNPVFDSKGHVVRIIKSVANITEQHIAKQRASEMGSQLAQNTIELTQSIAEISQRISRTARLAKDAEKGAAHAHDSVAQLNQSSAAIGDVVNLIQDLTEQTNLLALNATIEAARAGEFGRGFAVVAGEVKELANQTAKATKDIRKSIEQIQLNMADVVSAIQVITNHVGDVSSNTLGVASSVEQQSVLMQGLDRTARELQTLTRA